MSIKIEKGYMFKKNLSLLELNIRMIELRKLFADEITKHYRRQLVSLIYLYEDLYQIDKSFCMEKLKKFGSMYKVVREETTIFDIAANVNFNYRETVIKAMNSPMRNPMTDYSAQVQLYPLKDKILLRFLGESWLEDIIRNQEDIVDYHYQNHSDKPACISDTEWEQRYDDWKEAMPGWNTGRSGFSVQLFLDDDIPFMMDEIFIPGEYDSFKKTIDRRLDSVVEHYFIYPEFDGYNWDVFLEDKYNKFKKEKADEIREKIEHMPDPVHQLYERYA